jgi:hypothetical protein
MMLPCTSIATCAQVLQHQIAEPSLAREARTGSVSFVRAASRF